MSRSLKNRKPCLNLVASKCTENKTGSNKIFRYVTVNYKFKWSLNYPKSSAYDTLLWSFLVLASTHVTLWAKKLDCRLKDTQNTGMVHQTQQHTTARWHYSVFFILRSDIYCWKDSSSTARCIFVMTIYGLSTCFISCELCAKRNTSQTYRHGSNKNGGLSLSYLLLYCLL